VSWNGSTWPAGDDGWIYISNYNDLVAAHNERAAEVGHADLDAKSAGDWIEIGDILNLRTAVEALIPHFVRVDNGGTGEAFTKGSCLTDAIGQADWSDSGLAEDDWIYPLHYNELRDVLNELRWLLIGASGSATATAMKYSGSLNNPSYATVWGNVKTAYAAAAWASGTAVAYIRGTAYYDGLYNAAIQHNRCTDISYAIPDYAVGISDTKMRYRARSWMEDPAAAPAGGGPELTLSVFDQASFGGTESTDSIPTTGDAKTVMDVPTLAADNTTVHYSANVAAPADLDTLQPSIPGDAAERGIGSAGSDFELLIQLDFDYQ